MTKNKVEYEDTNLTTDWGFQLGQEPILISEVIEMGGNLYGYFQNYKKDKDVIS